MGIKKILLVDDDVAFCRSLTEHLELYDELATVRKETGTEGLAAIKLEHFDLILLDVGLPDLDGHEVCRTMRKSGVQIPIVMLSAADGDIDTILGLESGADDYVTKPFRFTVLLARIRAQLRQHEQSEDAVFNIGPYTFRPRAKVLLHDESNKKTCLTEKESSILKYLCRNEQHVVLRGTILKEVLGYNAEVRTHTLETHIHRLRKKIEQDPSNTKLLVAESGGYRLVFSGAPETLTQENNGGGGC